MGNLTKTKNSRKNQSQFQKLWSRVESLKTDINLRNSKLDALAKRVETEVFPAEKEVALATVGLLQKLLTLGQRKSWANWQHHEIETWISDSIRLLTSFDLIDEKLKSAIAAYDAFRLGIDLDEDDDRPLYTQLADAIDRYEQEELESERHHQQEMRDHLAKEQDEIIDSIVLSTLGPRPDINNTAGTNESLLKKLQAEYDLNHDELRKVVEEDICESLDGVLFDDDSEHDDNDFWENLSHEDSDNFFKKTKPESPINKTAQLDTATLRKMFRSTAAILHPDRESDPALQLEKQNLMTQLLQARKNRDVMALLSLYQEHVTDGTALNPEEEEQLISSLKDQVEQLKMELEHYTPLSMMHEAAWRMYQPSLKNTDNLIAEHLDLQKKQAESIRRVTPKIKSMPTLKPLLEQRYDSRTVRSFDDPLGW